MSEVVTASVSAVALAVAGIALAPAALAIVAALGCARLAAASRQLLEDSLAEVPSRLDAIGPASMAPVQGLRSRCLNIPAHEARLVEELASAARLAAGDVASLSAALRARPVEEWAGIIRENHHRLFVQSLSDAVARACRSLGCQVRTAEGQILAEDQGGRALAVEISPEGQLRAEVLGVADGSCHLLMDRFLRALQTEGVRIAEVGERRWTGGAPQTVTGRGWARSKVQTKAEARQQSRAGRRAKGKPQVARIGR